MASDDIVWDIINNQFCSYKIRVKKEQAFCRNEYNVSGYCSKQHCPLANSRYATVRSDPSSGRLYLYMKTAERAHTPNRWWERVRLPSNYNKALEAIDDRLIYWPKFLVYKCKQRLTRLTQVAIRSRRLQKEELRLGERLVPRLAAKVRSREATRERKAEAAAKVDRAIERELLERLRSGAYGDRPLNVEEGLWKKVLRGLERSGEGSNELENLEEEQGEEEEEEEEEENKYEHEIEYEMEGLGADVEYVSGEDFSESADEELEDLEDWIDGESLASDSDDNNSDDDDEHAHGKKGVDVDRKRLDRKQSTQQRAVKRSGLQPPRTRHKNLSKRASRQIEYEMEPAEPQVPQILAT